MKPDDRKAWAFGTVKELAAETSQIGAVSNTLMQLQCGTQEHSARLDKLEAEVNRLKNRE
jgi:hypothetical protein